MVSSTSNSVLRITGLVGEGEALLTFFSGNRVFPNNPYFLMFIEVCS